MEGHITILLKGELGYLCLGSGWHGESGWDCIETRLSSGHIWRYTPYCLQTGVRNGISSFLLCLEARGIRSLSLPATVSPQTVTCLRLPAKCNAPCQRPTRIVIISSVMHRRALESLPM